MLAAPLITRLVRSYGIRPPMLVGAAMFGGGFVAASFATQIWHLYLSQGALIGLGVGFAYVPSIAILSQWFKKRRSLVNGVSSAGSGIGGLIFSLATGAMIDNLGLGWALRVTGIIAIIALVIAAIFIRDRNKIVRPKQHPFDVHLVWRADVMLLLSWAFLSMLGYIALLYSLSDFTLSVGLSRQQATQVTAFLNLGTAIGRPFIGVASDRCGRFGVATTLTFVCGLLCLVLWIPATSFGPVVVFAILSGAILGVFWMVHLSRTSVRLVANPSIRRLRHSAWKSQDCNNYHHFSRFPGCLSFCQLHVRHIDSRKFRVLKLTALHHSLRSYCALSSSFQSRSSISLHSSVLWGVLYLC